MVKTSFFSHRFTHDNQHSGPQIGDQQKVGHKNTLLDWKETGGGGKYPRHNNEQKQI